MYNHLPRLLQKRLLQQTKCTLGVILLDFDKDFMLVINKLQHSSFA